MKVFHATVCIVAACLVACVSKSPKAEPEKITVTASIVSFEESRHSDSVIYDLHIPHQFGVLYVAAMRVQTPESMKDMLLHVYVEADSPEATTFRKVGASIRFTVGSEIVSRLEHRPEWPTRHPFSGILEQVTPIDEK